MIQDILHSFRGLAKRPGFALLAILTVTLGIAVNTAMFTIVNGVLWKPFPFPQQDRLVRFSEASPSSALNNSGPNSADWLARSHSFEDLAIYRPFPQVTLHLPERDRSPLVGYAHPNLFNVLRVQPAAGRFFADADDHPGTAPAAVITNAAWDRYFGKDPAIVGKTVPAVINRGNSVVIVGVLPPGVSYDNIEMWLPLGRFPMPPDAMRDNHWFSAIGRLKPGASVDAASREVEAISAALEKEYPATNKNIRAHLASLSDYYARRVKMPLLILFWAVAFVMLIACGNVVHLMLTRTLSRNREMAVRLALGAGAWRLLRLLLCEGALIASAGGAIGLLVARWLVAAAVKTQPGLLPATRPVAMDPQAILYSLAASAFTALMLAIFPVWRVARANVRDFLHSGGRGTAGPGQQRLGWLMVGAEIAMASVLLAGAGLMIQGLRNLSHVDLGYSPEGLLTVSLTAPLGKTYTDQASQMLLDRLQEAARTMPGAVSAAFAMPFSIGGNGMLAPTVIPGRANPSTPPFEPAMYVSPSFFETMRIPLRAGRTFSREEHNEVVVNEEFVHRFLPDENPVGRQIRLWSPLVIVGVVGNSRLQGTLTEVKPEIYLPDVNAAWSPTLLVRTTGPAGGAAGVLRDRIKEIEPGIRIGAIKTVETSETARTVVERFTRLVLVIFAAIATLLACLGIYGVASFSVAQRKHEIGIRIALGATRRDVAGLVFRQTLWAALAGTVAGAIGVMALSRLIRSFLYNVHAYDPATIASVMITIALVATLASIAPVLRASRVDPAISLRQD